MAIYDTINLSEHINLNITHLAQKVLDSDRLIFGAVQGKGLSFGTLVNTIISSYDNDFPLTESLIKKKDYLEKNIWIIFFSLCVYMFQL